MIRNQDRASLRAYAVDCCDVAFHMTMGFNTPVLTIGLVQGDALGGGFEGAMSFNILVAERSARLGLPEVLFNLFPGMGSMSFLSRKIGFGRAERMILSGKIYTAEELYDMGLVDVLAEDGEGEAEVRKFISGSEARYRLYKSLAQARQRVAPLTFEELCDITDIWVNTAMHLSETDLRRMERLALAQRRRVERA
jgi:DSF synthase